MLKKKNENGIFITKNKEDSQEHLKFNINNSLIHEISARLALFDE